MKRNVLAENLNVARRLHTEYINFLRSANTPEEHLEGRLEF